MLCVMASWHTDLTDTADLRCFLYDLVDEKSL